MEVNDILNNEAVYLGLEKGLTEFHRHFDQFAVFKKKKNRTIISLDSW